METAVRYIRRSLYSLSMFFRKLQHLGFKHNGWIISARPIIGMCLNDNLEVHISYFGIDQPFYRFQFHWNWFNNSKVAAMWGQITPSSWFDASNHAILISSYFGRTSAVVRLDFCQRFTVRESRCFIQKIIHSSWIFGWHFLRSRDHGHRKMKSSMCRL